eukprot:TRINITY_DN37329_c0_g1_i1.p1 TRINITY_DN37329_c0_g1~~TRINITY_DN37329_c0_g1_i1.p1  ORF type:complete len:103 (+),score=18.95 TRINITY_DN37329_c0_g1_i1:54-362(+)
MSVASAARELVGSKAHIVIFSKTYCGYCSRVINMMTSELGVKPEVHQLDRMSNGDAIQQKLKQLTGQSSVPNVFIGAKHIGGCDDTFALHRSGALAKLVKQE